MGADGEAMDGAGRTRRPWDVYLAQFSWTFLGIGMLRFWYQYNLYNLHATTDFGDQVALTNILRAIIIGVLLMLAWRRELTGRVRSVLVWGSLVFMTLSGVFHALDLDGTNMGFEVAHYVTCAIGLVWGGGMWMDFFARLSPARALCYLLAGVVMSCVLSLLCGYLPPYATSLINLFVPAVAVLAYWRATHVLDEQGAPPLPNQMDAAYDEGHRAGVVRLVLSYCIFTFVLGIALGFPDGLPRQLSQVERTLHQISLVALFALAGWQVLFRGKRLWFPALWCFENALLIVAIVLLMSEQPVVFELATALMLAAESVFYPMAFYTAYDLGRHMRRPAMFMLGVVYGGSLLCMGVGRLVSFFVASAPGGAMAMTVVMSVLVVVEMVLALRLAPTRFGLPLFSDVAGDAKAMLAGGGKTAEPPTDDNTVTPPVMAGVQDASGTVGVDQRSQEPLDTLTAVERSIVDLVIRGRSRSAIAQELGYSENTVRNYLRNAYHKLGIHSKQELFDLVEAHSSEDASQ